MKKLFLFTSIIILISTLALPFYAIAQLPEFTLVDTGAIYEFRPNRLHLSGIVFDADNDGDLDPVIGNSSDDPVPLVLYKNERNGLYRMETFIPETTNAFPITFTSPTGDIDNDGDNDVIGQKKWFGLLSAFFNDGYGNFTANSIFSLNSNPYSPYPVLLDFNGDGFLDLIRFDTAVSVLYNNGDGVFENKSKIGHYDKGNNVLQHSLSWADVDNDGDMDAYCGMTWHKNIFFLNTGTALVQVEEDHITLSEDEATHCVNWIDYNNDGNMDLYTVDALFENLGSMEFEKHIIREGIYDSHSTWSSSRVWGDLDNDGDLDLFVSVENNHLLGDFGEPISAHPYNLLYVNEGVGTFTNVLDNGLTIDDSHTAEIFDHDNDGDLDVLTIGNAWANNGRNMLYVNEGNDNTSILLNCIDKHGCATPYGTRVYAKTMINGDYVSQMREVTPVDGNLSFANTRLHFGLGDANIIDTVLIRWPSGHFDTCLDVPANQFYLAVENEGLRIDFKATNYIQYNPAIANIEFEQGETSTIDLKNHYQFIMGDTVPEINGDTLTFEIINKNPNIVTASLNENILTLEAGETVGDSKIEIIVSVGFTERMDSFTVTRGTDDISEYNNGQSVMIFPNPFMTSATIEYELRQPENVSLSIYNHLGQIVYQTEENQPQGKQQLIWNANRYAEGVYYYRLQVGDDIANGKIVKVR
jgi:hypothetical protein